MTLKSAFQAQPVTDITLEHQFELMKNAGFKTVQVLYQNCGTVIIKAENSSFSSAIYRSFNFHYITFNNHCLPDLYYMLFNPCRCISISFFGIRIM